MARKRNRAFACFHDTLELYVGLPSTTAIAAALNRAGIIPLCRTEPWDSRAVMLALRDCELPWRPSVVHDGDHHRARHPDEI